uniref:Putative LRR receptor-like serine/threonine-protein kinase n=1 Tax=Populus alba TaxID=43335 RepID=A0A4U5R0N2_POPAL|nr:putative LRR receptor-like serine/threonine-protein kinase [Populus alba]
MWQEMQERHKQQIEWVKHSKKFGKSSVEWLMEDAIENGTGGLVQPGAGASSSGGLTGNTNETPGDTLPASLHVEVDNVGTTRATSGETSLFGFIWDSVRPMFCERGSLSELVDSKIGVRVFFRGGNGTDAKLSLSYVPTHPTLRPTMSQVVSMLDSRTPVQDFFLILGFSAINTKYKAIRNHFWQNLSQTYSMSIKRSYCSDSTNSWRTELVQ